MQRGRVPHVLICLRVGVKTLVCLRICVCVCMKRDSRTALLTHLGFCKSHLPLSDHTHTNQADQSQLLWSALLQRSYITREVLGEG